MLVNFYYLMMLLMLVFFEYEVDETQGGKEGKRKFIFPLRFYAFFN